MTKIYTYYFIHKLAFILFVMAPSAYTVGNIVVYGSANQFVIYSMVWPANPTQFWSLTVPGVFFYCDCLNQIVSHSLD